jgi:hypothetical protein
MQGKRSSGEWEMFRKVVWVRPSFVELGVDARLIYLWGWTSPEATLSGLIRASPRQLARAIADAEVPVERLARALHQLARKPLALYDDVAEVLWIVGRVEHVNRSPKVATRVVREWETCESPVIREQFAELYGEKLGLNGAGAHA